MTDFTDSFNDLTNWDTTNAGGAFTTPGDGYVDASLALKATGFVSADQSIQKTDLANLSISDRTYYVSFGLFIPSWEPFSTVGRTRLIGFDTPSGTRTFQLIADTDLTGGGVDPTIGWITIGPPAPFGSGTAISLVPAGEWVAVEISVIHNSGPDTWDWEVWLNNTSVGTGSFARSAPPDRVIFYMGADDGTYYLDPFEYDSNARIGPVDLGASVDPGGGGDGGGGAAAGRVSIAFDAAMLDASPAWTLIDTIRGNLVARIEIRDGRQTEQDETETGTATIYLNDTTGLFDPNNLSSPYFGKLDSKPIKVELYNPVTATLVPQWRGTIDDIKTRLEPASRDGVSVVANVQIECVDIFDYLARAEMQIGVSGDVPPAGSEATIFYEDGPIANPGGPPGRIEQLLLDAGIDPDMFVVFSGNVDVLETKYDPGDEFLTALKDAVDAELPGLANQYVDKLGRYVFHGRFARLDPDGVIADGPVSTDVWDFHRWKAGDGAAITDDPDNAQIREFAMGRPREMLINSAICYPENIQDTDIADQLITDFTSITEHGIHGRSDVNLIVKGHKTNGDTGDQQCAKYAQFWINEYAFPRQRIDTIVFKSLHPSDPRAASTWALLTGVSISDIVNVNVGYPGGSGIQDKDFYVEGRQLTIEPLQPGFDMVTLELNLSPAVTDTGGVFD